MTDESITTLKKELKTHQETLQVLLALTHEWHTFVGTLNVVDDLKKTPLNNEQKRQVEKIDWARDVILTLTNNIIDFIRLQTGQTQFGPRPFDLRESLTYLVDRVSQLADYPHKELIITLADNVPAKIMTDPPLLEDVLVNLIRLLLPWTDKVEMKVIIGSRGSVGLGSHAPEDNAFQENLYFTITAPTTINPDKAVQLTHQTHNLEAIYEHEHPLEVNLCQGIAQILGGEIWFAGTLDTTVTAHFICPIYPAT